MEPQPIPRYVELSTEASGAVDDREGLDRARQLAEHRAVADRVGRDVDEAVRAAAEKRRAYEEHRLARHRIKELVRLEEGRLWALVNASASRGQPGPERRVDAERGREGELSGEAELRRAERHRREEAERLLQDLAPGPHAGTLPDV